jgi:hypothetical protein
MSTLHLHPEDGNRKFLQSVINDLQHITIVIFAVSAVKTSNVMLSVTAIKLKVQYAPKYRVLKLMHLESACAFVDGAQLQPHVFPVGILW